jgi:hypothetical protein
MIPIWHAVVLGILKTINLTKSNGGNENEFSIIRRA